MLMINMILFQKLLMLLLKGKLTIQCDEMWVGILSWWINKKWIWLAIDINTKEIVGTYIGNLDIKGAKGLWDSLPPVYKQCAVSYTDFWEAYNFPEVTNQLETGLTNRIERFNCTMRQRISRLVRSTLSFSKKLSNHIGAIFYSSL